MQAGALRHRITIQSMAETMDQNTGIITTAWAPFATDVPADVHPLSAREFVAAAASQSKVTATIKIRYLAGLKASMRAVQGEKTWNIEGVLPDPKSGKEYLTLPVSEVSGG